MASSLPASVGEQQQEGWVVTSPAQWCHGSAGPGHQSRGHRANAANSDSSRQASTRHSFHFRCCFFLFPLFSAEPQGRTLDVFGCSWCSSGGRYYSIWNISVLWVTKCACNVQISGDSPNNLWTVKPAVVSRCGGVSAALPINLNREVEPVKSKITALVWKKNVGKIKSNQTKLFLFPEKDFGVWLCFKPFWLCKINKIFAKASLKLQVM